MMSRVRSLSVIPWDRLDGESPPAFEAFVAYRGAGHDRSVRKLARQIGKSPSLLFRWCSRHEWASRTQAWDTAQELAEYARKDDGEARRAYLLRLLEAAQLGQLAASIEMERRVKTDPDIFKDLDDLALADLARKNIALMPRMVKLEWEVAGVSTRSPGAGSEAGAAPKRAEDLRPDPRSRTGGAPGTRFGGLVADAPVRSGAALGRSVRRGVSEAARGERSHDERCRP
jgi:hypothetical protein